MNEFNLHQQHLANRLGVAEEMIRELRKQHLVAGVHYRKVANRILYASAAEEILRGVLAVPPAASPEMASVDLADLQAQRGKLVAVLRTRTDAAKNLGATGIAEKGEVRSSALPGDAGEFKVVRLLPNPRFVVCVAEPPEPLFEGRLPSAPKPVEVRVRDNRLLIPGMVLECVLEASGWVCPRVPRQKGRW
jgi:hypothetical protein